jgi:hypothetical protein
MTGVDAKSDLLIYLQGAREAGLVTHSASMEHADATIAALPLDAIGRVPWWGEDGERTLHRIVVRMTAETGRHAGHADIVRELIDGAAGLLEGSDNLPSAEQHWWREYSNHLDQAARSAAGQLSG